jgi:hypothetical protein
MESATQRALKRQQRLMQLIEIYTLWTGRLSEAIAVLGEGVTPQRPIDEIMIEIEKLSSLVENARADLLAFFGESPEESSKE